jgi:aryl-alcohol dehydrogenase-like predicted oxidoreductase
MKLHRLGNSNVMVSRLGFGCARLGGVFGRADRREMIDLLRAGHDSGINFFDTSDMYTQGESERIIGQAFRRDRGRVVIATKAGYVLPVQGRVASKLKPALRPVLRRLGLRRRNVPAIVRGSLSQNFTPRYLRSAAERSLRRLHTDYIDLYQLHSPSLSVLEAGEFIPALDLLVQEGKIRYYGISCQETDHIASALRHPVTALQFRVNLLNQSAAREAIGLAAAAGVGIIARECLGGGTLTRPSDWLAQAVTSGIVPADDAAQIAAIQRVAAQRGQTVYEAGLGWVLSQPSISVVLVGMRNREQLAQNVAEASGRPSESVYARAQSTSGW